MMMILARATRTMTSQLRHFVAQGLGIDVDPEERPVVAIHDEH